MTGEGGEAGGSKKEEDGIERQPCQVSPKITTHHHSACQARAALEVSSLLHKPRVQAVEGVSWALRRVSKEHLCGRADGPSTVKVP